MATIPVGRCLIVGTHLKNAYIIIGPSNNLHSGGHAVLCKTGWNVQDWATAQHVKRQRHEPFCNRIDIISFSIGWDAGSETRCMRQASWHRRKRLCRW